MSERLLILQNDRDRLVERVDALEANALATHATSDTVGDAPTRPALKVVKLVPNPQADEQRRPDGSELPPTQRTSAQTAPAHAVQEGASGADDDPTRASTTQPSDTAALPTQVEPRVVLYGEGPASGIRAVPAGEEP